MIDLQLNSVKSLMLQVDTWPLKVNNVENEGLDDKANGNEPSQHCDKVDFGL